jgi:c-di-GMP-binding flagellar brake protein YcgR
MSPPVQKDAVGPSIATPVAHALLEPTDYTQYLLRTKNEVLFILRGLLASTDHLTIYFNEGKDFLLSAVIQVDDDGLILDYGGNAEANERALAADRLFCVTTHDKIRVQFVLRGLRQIDYQGQPAFRAALPDTVLRLQRREYYRLTTPIAHPIKCQIPVMKEGGLCTTTMEANVVDISGGGLAMMVPPVGLIFSSGDVFENCRIELPEVGVVITTLEVRNVFDVTLRTGTQVARAGCQFANLPGQMLTLIQRYIIKVERERKARDAGMA